jgi:hypothetical protein
MRLELRRPVWALHVLVVGLAFHNLVISQLWHAGLRGGALSAVSAWKDVLLLAALVAVVWARRGLPFSATPTDWLALGFAALVVLYAVLPQSALDGEATTKGVLYALRHDLLPVEAYFLGRGLQLSPSERRSLVRTILATGAVLAALGLADVFLVHLQWWRTNGTVGWFTEQLGIDKRDNGLSGLPENFVLNAGHGVVYRRLVSTFLSPLATAYLLVVALLALVAFRRSRWRLAAPLLLAALLWTHTRAAVVALVGGLAVAALAARSRRAAVAAVVVAAVGLVFFHEYRHLAPRTHFTAEEQAIQNAHAHAPGVSGGVTSNQEHASTLWEGIRNVVRHPQGFGLGNAGVTAVRSGVLPAAGESTYTEIGVETGLLGALLFVAWCLALFWGSLSKIRWIGAAFAAVLAIGVQTDVIGVPWIGVVVWALAADAV